MSFKQQVELMKSWAYDPKKFVIEALNAEEITTQQAQGLEEIRRVVTAKIRKFEGEALSTEDEEYARKTGVSIMSGHGTGKDCMASWVILWYLSCFPYPKIPCTAPTGHQLKDVLWSEISKWLRKSKVSDWHTWQSDKVYFNEAGGKEWFAVARTANPRATAEEQGETLAGFHEDFLLYVIDEASGIPEPVFKPIEGALTGKCNFVLMIFNPTRSKGFAVESHRKDRSRWVPIRWNAEESERVDKEHIAEMARKYGRDSNTYRIRVLGLPPTADEHTLIQYDWVMDAINRDIEPLDTDVDVIGFDVGGGGDESVMCPRKGPKVYPVDSSHFDQSEQLTGWALRHLLDKGPKYCMVDTIGIGWGISGNLRSRQHICDIIDVNVSESPAEDTRFYKLRDELWWRVREEFEKGIISIPDDPILIAELTTIKFDERPDGKIQIESKRDMKKRGIESPNRADALMLTEYFGVDLTRKMQLQKKKKKDLVGSSWRTV